MLPSGQSGLASQPLGVGNLTVLDGVHLLSQLLSRHTLRDTAQRIDGRSIVTEDLLAGAKLRPDV